MWNDTLSFSQLISKRQMWPFAFFVYISVHSHSPLFFCCFNFVIFSESFSSLGNFWNCILVGTCCFPDRSITSDWNVLKHITNFFMQRMSFYNYLFQVVGKIGNVLPSFSRIVLQFSPHFFWHLLISVIFDTFSSFLNSFYYLVSRALLNLISIAGISTDGE